MSVDINVVDGIATILLNNPGKLNALTDNMLDQLAAHLDRCKTDNAVKAVILTGAGRGFCSGADLSGEGRTKERKPGMAFSLEAMEEYNTVVRRIYHLSKPTIAAVRGPAIGFAWTMALSCDMLLVTESAKFRPAFLNLAKVPEGGFQYLVTRLIGELKARELIYRAQFVSGPEAVKLGLATQLVSEEALQDEAEALAQEMANLAPITFALTKRLFNANATSFDQFLEQEINAIAFAANTEDAKEAMAAFKEKRAPKYSGY